MHELAFGFVICFGSEGQFGALFKPELLGERHPRTQYFIAALQVRTGDQRLPAHISDSDPFR